ncbi:acyl-CoA dehydrogenase family protein [Peribacillus butanolivorans]|uniref:acyl-CoA dehydrogenase family protein n=1 Tax=Peribacillus butanolivorans TaxID=421767 RepID=UPI0036DA5BBF
MENLIDQENLASIQSTVRSFVKQYVIPLESSGKKIGTEEMKQLKVKAKELKYWSIGSKKEWGGAGLSIVDRVLIMEEAAQHRNGFSSPALGAFGEDLPSFFEHSTEYQLDNYIKPAVRSGKGCYIAIWEPENNQDIRNLKATAVKHEGDWIIQGKKAYISRFDAADFGVVLVNYMEGGNLKPTLFLLDKADSIEKEKVRLIDVQDVHHIILKDVRIPDDRRIGEVGEGIDLLKNWLIESQIMLAARCLGIGEKAKQLAVEYSSIRVTRGQPLSGFSTIRSLLARSETELQAARLLIRDAAVKLNTDSSGAGQAAQMAKLFATEAASKAIDNSLQIHGGVGYAGDEPLEQWYKEIRISRVIEGKSETLIKRIASHMYRSQR